MKKRTPIIAGNWKMNNTRAEAETLVRELVPLVKNAACEVVLCAPFTALETVARLIKGTKIKLGAQNVAWADKGAFTGEISAAMLTELGVEYVIIGHSERRQMFGETDESVNARTVNALKRGLKPIVCVGETESQRESGVTESVLRAQLDGGLKNVAAADVSKIIIAYEPVWAIGTGKTATAADANAVIGFIRAYIGRAAGKDAAERIRIQYGGSMNAANAAELMAKSEIDGGLIGGASLKAADFAKIAEAAGEISGKQLS